MLVERYIKRAEEAEAQAAAASDPRDRDEYLEIARLWRDLAQRRMAKDAQQSKKSDV